MGAKRLVGAPLVGVLIGLAAASKWVGIYALAGIWILVLARSALGRFLLVCAGVAWSPWSAGIDAPWPFTVLALGALALALLIVWVRPIRLRARRPHRRWPPARRCMSGIGLAFALAYDQVPDAGSRTARWSWCSACWRAARRPRGPPGSCSPSRPCCWSAARRPGRWRDPDSDRRWLQPRGAWPASAGRGSAPAWRSSRCWSTSSSTSRTWSWATTSRGGIGRPGLWLDAGRAARPDVRLPLRPAGRPPVAARRGGAGRLT